MAAAFAGIPVKHEVLVGNRRQDSRGFFAVRRVTGHFVFQQQD